MAEASSIRVDSLQDILVAEVRRSLYVLWGAVSLVLLIARHYGANELGGILSLRSRFRPSYYHFSNDGRRNRQVVRQY